MGRFPKSSFETAGLKIIRLGENSAATSRNGEKCFKSGKNSLTARKKDCLKWNQFYKERRKGRKYMEE